MRTALQAAFGFGGTTSGDETREKREKIERELRRDERSVRFFQRLRAATSQTDLNAPEVFAEESFPDANIVAEYLDCANIASEIVAEYEKVCWESPEILAEIGCCFDFLTNALVDAVEPPVNCRRRLYYIAWEETALESKSEENGRLNAFSARPPLASAAATDPTNLTNLTNTTNETVSPTSQNAQNDVPLRAPIVVNGAERRNPSIFQDFSDSDRGVASPSTRAQTPQSPRKSTRRRVDAADKARRSQQKERSGRDNEIAQTLNAGRRAKRSRRWALVACALCGIAIASYKTLTINELPSNNDASATFADKEKLGRSNGKFVERESQPQSEIAVADASTPLLPSTISRADSVDANALDPEFLAFSSENVRSNGETLPQKSAPLAEIVDAGNPPTSREFVHVAASFDAPRNGGGLNSSNLNKKPSLVIPEKNNDVFSKPLRF